MIEPVLQWQLRPVIRRQRRMRFWRDLATGLWATALFAFLFWEIFSIPTLTRNMLATLLLAGGGLSAIAAWQSARRWSPDFRKIAREIEAQHPELHALLLTAVEQQPDAKSGKLN